MDNFYKHIFRGSRLQMFLKIYALKNFATLRIKKILQHKCFRVRSSHMMLTYWYIFSQNTYHYLLAFCKYYKIFKNSFFIEHLQKQLFADVLQNKPS